MVCVLDSRPSGKVSNLRHISTSLYMPDSFHWLLILSRCEFKITVSHSKLHGGNYPILPRFTAYLFLSFSSIPVCRPLRSPMRLSSATWSYCINISDKIKLYFICFTRMHPHPTSVHCVFISVFLVYTCLQATSFAYEAVISHLELL